MTIMNAIVFLVTVCNYTAPISMTTAKSLYFNEFQTALKTCTKNNIVMDVQSNHKFVEFNIPCEFQAHYDPKPIININNYNTTNSLNYAYELMLYATSIYNTSGYEYQMMIMPAIPIIQFAGIGTIGGSFSWYLGENGYTPRVFMHEYGHNLGFGHSRKNGQEYADNSCIMGSGEWSMCYTAPHRYIAGFDTPQYTMNNITQITNNIVIDKTNYMVVNDTIFIEAKTTGTYVYYLTNDKYTCNICTLYNEGQACIIQALGTSITVIESTDAHTVLNFMNNMKDEYNTTDLCQQAIVINQPSQDIPPSPPSIIDSTFKSNKSYVVKNKLDVSSAWRLTQLMYYIPIMVTIIVIILSNTI